MSFKFVTLALATLLVSSGCVIHADSDSPPRRSSGTTTTTTTTTVTEEHHPAPAPAPAPAPIPDFVPMMSSVTADTIEWDSAWETSWQAYTMHFTDVADSYICSPNMPNETPGSVVTIHLSGYEIEDEYAACPTGSYLVVPDCDLWEGEACVEIQWRDLDGFDAGGDYATVGHVDISLEAGFHGDPYICHVSTRVDGHPDMSFDFEMVYEEYDLAPGDRGGAVCTM